MTAAPPVAAAVTVRSLSAEYGIGPFRREALHGVTMTAPPGEVTAVVGPNGAGKTTLFGVLLGFHRPTGGRARIGGLAPAVFRRRHGVAFLPESTPRPGGWTLESLLEEGADLQGLGSRRRRDAIDRALHQSGLGPREHRTDLRRLSKGRARRAILAYALLGDPAVVLLDEPLAGLDPAARAGLRDVVADVTAAGSTVLLSSHELAEVARMADRAVVLRAGRVVRTVSELEGPLELERAVLEAHDTGGGTDPDAPAPGAGSGVRAAPADGREAGG